MVMTAFLKNIKYCATDMTPQHSINIKLFVNLSYDLTKTICKKQHVPLTIKSTDFTFTSETPDTLILH